MKKICFSMTQNFRLVISLVVFVTGFVSVATAASPPEFEILSVDATLTERIDSVRTFGLRYTYVAPDAQQFLQIRIRLKGEGRLALSKENLRLMADGGLATFYGSQSAQQASFENNYPRIQLSSKGTADFVTFLVPLDAKKYGLEIAGKSIDIVPGTKSSALTPPALTVVGARIMVSPLREVHKRFGSPERITEIATDGLHLLRVEVDIVPGFSPELGERFEMYYNVFWLGDKQENRSTCLAGESGGEFETNILKISVPPREGKWEQIREVIYFLIPEAQGEFKLHYGDSEGVVVQVGG